MKPIDFKTYKDSKGLSNFIYEVIFLSQRREVDARFDLNLIIPHLVRNTFDPKMLEEVYDEMLEDYKKNTEIDL